MKIARNQKGEGEFGFLISIMGICILVSGTMLVLGWVKSVKDARYAPSTAQTDFLPPASSEDFGAYQVTY